MENHYSKNLRAGQISRACGLSESHFRRTFEEVMRVSPMDYLNQIRIKNACNLINEKNVSMEEIGRMVGYQTPSTFNRNFKRITGMQPLRWKQEVSTHRGRIADFNVKALKGWI